MSPGRGGRGPATWRAKLSQRQGARAALDRPRLTDPATPDPAPAPRDRFVDHPPLVGITHPTWWHVYRLEESGPVLIAECRDETAAIFVMARERWQTRLMKWRQPPLDSFHPRKPGA
jgi:hypothetical protein